MLDIYTGMVDEIAKNKEAYSFFIQHFYHVTNYHYLKQEDVRSIDVKEWLFTNICVPRSLQNQYDDPDSLYLSLLSSMIGNKIRCEKDSRAEKYKNHAIKILDEAKADSAHYRRYDALMILLSLIRGSIDELQTQTKLSACNPEIKVTCEDAELINKLRNSKALESCIPKSGKETSAKIFFVYSIMLLTRMLQECGTFSAPRG